MSTTELAGVSEKSRQCDYMKPTRLDDSLYSKELAPHYMQLATKLASSELIPKSFRGKPQDLFICWAMGYQVGLTPEQSQQCIAVINGKPAMWGDDMLALCMSHKDFDDIEEHPIRTKDDTVIGYVCTVHRKGKKPKTSEFTLDMAKRAGLLAKGGVWNQYPERMLKLRARGFCLRDAFPDALKGIKPREEVEDYIDADYTVIERKGSRTEQLKQDIISKQGEVNEMVDEGNGSTPIEEHKGAIEENQPDALLQEETEIVSQEAELHTEIKRLLLEKQFTEDRLTKALSYYEVGSIEELSLEAADNFIEKLVRL